MSDSAAERLRAKGDEVTALERLRAKEATVDDLRELLPKLLAVYDGAVRLVAVRVAGCLCCNPEACDACPPCPKCEPETAIRTMSAP